VLERRGGEYVLTGAGQRLRPYLEKLEEDALAVERVAAGHDVSLRGAVRMTTTESLATYFLAARLGGFRARFPEIELEVVIARRSLDLARREADLALRMAPPRQEGLVARKVGEAGIALYASHDYLAIHGAPRPGEPAEDHWVVGNDEESAWLLEDRWLSSRLPGAKVSVRTNGWPCRLAATEAGLGIAPLLCFIADRSPSLRRIGGPEERTVREIWLLVHRDLKKVGRVRAVLDFLAGLVTENAALLAGVDSATPPVRREKSRGPRSHARGRPGPGSR
jgi:DNA-binding transcriptional LysR family regulator